MILFLIGFMGSGKSYIGQKLADMLSLTFVDLDKTIEHTEQATISTLFEQHGETYFRNIEADSLRRLGKWSDLIVATGGGAPCFHDNMAWMNAHGLTIYLDTDIDLLVQRLEAETAHRPLLVGKNLTELRTFIAAKMAERAPFYAQAQVIVPQKENGDGIVFDILAAIARHRGLIDAPPSV